MKPSAPLPARPNNTGNTAPRPQHNPNDARTIPPVVVLQKPHTGHEGCKPDWLSPRRLNDILVPPFFSIDEDNTDGRDGAGKNGQHGRHAPPSLQEQLDKYKGDLIDLKANQGPKKEKDEIAKKINNIQKKIDQMPKGKNHSMKAKGTGGGRSR